MSEILWVALILCLMMINPAFVSEWLKSLLSNPEVFLTGLTVGFAIGIAWNRRESQATKKELEFEEKQRKSLETQLVETKKSLEECKKDLAYFQPPIYGDSQQP